VKSLLRILLLTLAFNSYSQERISVSVLQDAKLAILGDDIGNDPFTADFIVRLDMEGAGRFKYISLRTEWEYADLAGGYYNRGGIMVGLNYIVKNFVLSAHIGPNIIKRRYMKIEGGVLAWSFNGELAYNITDRISVIASNQLLNRADVVNEPIRYSFFTGARFYLEK
jgi:hypothetical protein